MANSKIGPLPDSAFETDIIPDPHAADRHYSLAQLASWRKHEEHLQEVVRASKLEKGKRNGKS